MNDECVIFVDEATSDSTMSQFVHTIDRMPISNAIRWSFWIELPKIHPIDARLHFVFYQKFVEFQIIPLSAFGLRWLLLPACAARSTAFQTWLHDVFSAGYTGRSGTRSEVGG